MAGARLWRLASAVANSSCSFRGVAVGFSRGDGEQVGYRRIEALREAVRRLECVTPPCVPAYPIGVNISGFIWRSRARMFGPLT
jgi:hypothetical protein